VYGVADTVVSGDESALQVLAGVRVIAVLVQLLAALGTQPRGGQQLQVCGPPQQAVQEAQLALDAEAGIVGSVYLLRVPSRIIIGYEPPPACTRDQLFRRVTGRPCMMRASVTESKFLVRMTFKSAGAGDRSRIASEAPQRSG